MIYKLIYLLVIDQKQMHDLTYVKLGMSKGGSK
jgi:hypothetical protein